MNDTLSRQLWNGQALGQRLRYGQRTLEIVGVVRDSKYSTIGETVSPTVYLPFRQTYAFRMTLHARTTDIEGTARLMVDELRRLAPNAPVSVKRMSDAVAVSVVPAQVGAASTGIFGLVAMLLSAIGHLRPGVVRGRTAKAGVRHPASGRRHGRRHRPAHSRQ